MARTSLSNARRGSSEVAAGKGDHGARKSIGSILGPHVPSGRFRRDGVESDSTRSLAELEEAPSLSCWSAVHGRLRGKGWRGYRSPRPLGRGAPPPQHSTCLLCSGSSLAPSQAPVLPLCLTNIAG